MQKKKIVPHTKVWITLRDTVAHTGLKPNIKRQTTLLTQEQKDALKKTNVHE